MKATAWKQLGAVRWRRSEQDPQTFFYLPTAPGPVQDASGKPSVALTLAGDKAYLSLSAQWDPPAALLEDLRAKLADLNKDVPAAAIRIAPPPPLQVEDATLGTETAGGFDELGTVRSSGYPPWTATFSVELDQDAAEAAKAALHGEHHKLAVRFRAQLEGKSVESWTDVGKWFDPSPTEGEQRAQDR